MSSSSSKDCSYRSFAYNRKDKSLGLLCQNFLALYNREGVDLVGLDEAANRLGVERRRIYDIVNVLESIGVISKKAKNQYTWKGFGGIPQALEKLKEDSNHGDFKNTLPMVLEEGREDAIREECEGPLPIISDHASDGEVDENSSKPNSQAIQVKCSPSSLLMQKGVTNEVASKAKIESRREKSLGLLTQNFVKLFLNSKAEVVSLEEAAILLLGEANDSLQLRSTKVRRLYDIANVLSSMDLIEKTHHSVTRKPSFRWLGVQGKLEKKSDPVSLPHVLKEESTKRKFGTELCINNIDSKRNKFMPGLQVLKARKEISTDTEHSNGKPLIQIQSQPYNREQQDPQKNIPSKGFVYGPFSPACPSRANMEDTSKGHQDWDALAASFHPRYKNQALSDLFNHYLDAWQSWYAQVTTGGGHHSDHHASQLK